MKRPSFKELVREDIKRTFLNPEEMGEEHILNGVRVMVVIDEQELVEREKKYKGVNGELHMKQLLFYIAAEDFGPLPAPGKIINMDNKDYIITDAANEDGIYSISLEANEV